MMAATTDDSETIHITLPESSFEMYNAEAPSLEIDITKKELMDMYTKMTTMRRMEMAADGLYKAKKIRGFCHLCNGQVSVLLMKNNSILYIYIYIKKIDIYILAKNTFIAGKRG